MGLGTLARRLARNSKPARRARIEALRAERAALAALSGGRRPDPRQVIFEAYAGRSFACSPKAVYQEMLQDPRFADHEFTWAFTTPEKFQWIADEDRSGRTRVVRFKSRDYFRAYAAAGTWVVNAMVPLVLPKRRDQFMVQTWHGSPLKRLRTDVVENTKAATADYDEIVRKNDLDVARWDLLLSPSPFATRAFTSAFALERLGKNGIVHEGGYPRNAELFRPDLVAQAGLRGRLGIPEGKKVLMYAPTWRDDQYDPARGYVFDPGIDFDRLAEAMGPEWVVAYRGHYSVTSGVDFSRWRGFVYDVSQMSDVNEVYAISDALMTDYSSVFFDYAVLDRPILFYMYDLDYYAGDLRGFYLDLDELPGEIVRTEDEVFEVLADVEAYARATEERRGRFAEIYCPHDGPEAARLAVDEICRRRRELSF